MKRLLTYLMVLIVAAGCGKVSNNKELDSNPIISKKVVIKESITDTLMIDCDSIFKEKGYYAMHVIFDPYNEDDKMNNSIFILKKDNNEIIFDSIYSKVQEIQFIDFNNDGEKDILIQNTSDARSNWTYYLYLSNPNSTNYSKVKGFNIIKNPRVLSDINIIESYVSSGTNYYEFFKFTKDDSIHKFDILVYDNHDEVSKSNYDKAISDIQKN